MKQPINHSDKDTAIIVIIIIIIIIIITIIIIIIITVINALQLIVWPWSFLLVSRSYTQS
jgi:hypothetical protein